ncbi:MAG: Mur ligase domain-containing protein [Candidatus Kaiserbacteria bacterium]|nr:Mur ligase domain-containing protein [Candidatus Kaiserbacteria bacterium]
MRIPQNIYMVGIGGIGMSALAQLLVHQGKNVSGSDREESPTTKLLAEKGVSVSIGHDSCLLPADAELLIYSDAVWPDNPERMRAKEMGIPELSYFEALGIVSKNMRTLAVTGTHGKTTTTGMLASILKHAGKNPSAIVGSIVSDFGSNYLEGRDDLLVVEACEYKDHMLKLSPEILVITNAEWDHTDYFPTLGAMLESFGKAVRAVPKNGIVVANPNGPNMDTVLKGVTARIVDYTKEEVPKLHLLGEFNRENARAAKAAARAVFPDILEFVVDEALTAFKGSWRRFECKGETPKGALVYDDYAHHPTAIQKTLQAVREKFPNKKIVVAFHAHLYSRTRDLMQGFGEALAKADEAIIAPIYPAREEPIPGITNRALAEAVCAQGGCAHALDSFDEIRRALLSFGPDTLILTMGAGDIYKVAEQISDQH